MEQREKELLVEKRVSAERDKRRRSKHDLTTLKAILQAQYLDDASQVAIYKEGQDVTPKQKHRSHFKIPKDEREYLYKKMEEAFVKEEQEKQQ